MTPPHNPATFGAIPPARLVGILCLVFVACSPPQDGTPSSTCPAERVCGDGCCPANQICDGETQECIRPCTKTTCTAAAAQCGSVPDGCGGQLDCGSCADGAACGTDHTCPANTCVSTGCSGRNCGDVVDNCGKTIGCGTCSGEDTCGGAGTPNVCGHQTPCERDPLSCYHFCTPGSEQTDFGTVDVGTSKTLTLTFTNCGDVDITVRSITLSPGPFVVAAQPTQPFLLTPSASYDVVLAFAPTAANQWSITLRTTTNFGDTALLVQGTGRVPPPACDATTRPTPSMRVLSALGPDLTANPTVNLPAVVTFDASASAVPRGNGTFAWTIVSKPAGSTAQFVYGNSPAQVTLGLDQVGDYVVGLTITDPARCASLPVQTTVHAV